MYDRAGRGWSDAAANPPDGAQIATDLHTLLDRAQVPGPYVLAGHSFGGLYVRTYAARYPDVVAGLVLVDSTAASTRTAPPPQAGSYSVEHASSLIATTAWLGLGRLMAATSYSKLPPVYRDDCRATAATGTEMAGVLAEYLVASRSAAAAGTLHSLDAKPLIVLTASEGSRKGWMRSQSQMAELSTNSDHRVEPGATHSAFVDDPDHTAAVTRAIHDVVIAVRTGAPVKRQ